jgi:hypothetical protein
MITKYIEFRSKTENTIVKRVTLGSTPEYLFWCIAMCYFMYSLCTVQYIQYSSGILVVFAIMMYVAENVDRVVVDGIKEGLAGLWIFCEVFLFTTTGVNLSLKSQNGPQQSDRGIVPSEVAHLIYLLVGGSVGRLAGIIIVQFLNYGTLKNHRKEPKYMSLWIIATWVFQMPKATIQATLGGLPYAMHIIPGGEGITKGLFIQQGSAFAILFMATIGVVLTAVVGRPIAIYLQSLELASVSQTEDVKTINSCAQEQILVEKEIQLVAETHNEKNTMGANEYHDEEDTIQ